MHCTWPLVIDFILLYFVFSIYHVTVKVYGQNWLFQLYIHRTDPIFASCRASTTLASTKPLASPVNSIMSAWVMIASWSCCKLVPWDIGRQGCHIVGQSESAWPQIGSFRDFFRSDFTTKSKCREIWSEKIPDLSHLGPKSDKSLLGN